MLAAGLLSLVASCDSAPENHKLSPVANSIILYADQTSDSLRFYTYDSWSVESQNEWIDIEGDSHFEFTYNNMNCYLFKVMLSVEPNMTGKTRYGTVLVKSYDYSYSSPIVQLGLLMLTHPYFTVDSWLDEQSRIPDVAYYELIDSAHWDKDSICFTMHDNWKLEYVGDKPDWLSFHMGEGNEVDKVEDYEEGKYTVYLTLTPNVAPDERKATLRLTSGKVSNDIVVRQLPAKQE